jgi:pimeloyl-ACP methyl ester carboxylesterase
MSERTETGADPLEVVELTLGPGLPTLKIGSGSRTLAYFPGLTVESGLPTGGQLRLAVSGWEALLGDYSIFRIGRRVRPVGTSFVDMADDVVGALEELGRPIDLMGASTGGMLALHVAAARPDLVRRLVIVISGATLSDYGRRAAQRAIAAARAGRWRSVYATVMPIGARSGPGRVAYGALGWLLGPRLMGVPSDPTPFLAELEAWLEGDRELSLDRITNLTLVVGGANDPVFPPEILEATARRLRNATVTIVPSLAHDFPARLTNDHIAPFLLAEDA